MRQRPRPCGRSGSCWYRSWRGLAASTGALKGLRKDKSPENLLWVLLMHLGCGHSLRERKAQLAELSSAAVWKRLKKSRDWL